MKVMHKLSTRVSAGLKAGGIRRDRGRLYLFVCAVVAGGLVLPACDDEVVTPATPSIVLSPSGPIDLTVGEQAQLSASVRNHTGDVTFSSSRPGVASVSATGLVTALEEGTTTVSARVEGTNLVASVEVRVSAPEGTETRLRVDVTSVSHSNGQVPEGEQIVDLVDEDGNVVGSIPLVFTGPVFLDEGRGVFGLGTDGRIRAKVANATLPDDAPGPEDITLEVAGQDNTQEVSISYERQDAGGNVQSQGSFNLANTTIRLLLAPYFIFWMVTANTFVDFILYLIF